MENIPCLYLTKHTEWRLLDDTIEIIADSLWCQVSVWWSQLRKKRHNGKESQSNGSLIHHVSIRCLKALKTTQNNNILVCNFLVSRFHKKTNKQTKNKKNSKSSNWVYVSTGESCSPTSDCTFEACSTSAIIPRGWILKMPLNIKNDPTHALQLYVLCHCWTSVLRSRAHCEGPTNGNEQVSL